MRRSAQSGNMETNKEKLDTHINNRRKENHIVKQSVRTSKVPLRTRIHKPTKQKKKEVH